MTFSDTTTKLGLIQDCEMNIFGNYGDISDNTDRLYDFTARLNRSLDKYDTRVKLVDGRWQKDDPNYTDLPIASSNLVSGQQDYTMDVEFLDIVKVIALDTSGNRHVLNPLDITDGVARPYLMDVNDAGGIPSWYDKTGDTIMLYPEPNYPKTSGLIVHYRRRPSYFTYTDTTKSPGVPFTFQRYISLDTSLDYAISKQLAVKNDLQIKVKEMEELIDATFSQRSKDEQKFIRGRYRSSR